MSPVLFIAGTSYCGSTLTSLVLNAHPQMVSVGELTGPLRPPAEQAGYPCSCGEALASCPFWREVGKRAADRGVDFGPGHWDLSFQLGREGPLRTVLSHSLAQKPLDDLRQAAIGLVPGLRARREEIGERNRAVIEAVLEVSGARVFVDASKEPVRARHLQQVPDLEVWLLHLVRDPRGFANSDQRRGEYPLARSARIWKRSIGQVECVRRALPAERFLRVRYEALCADVPGELRRITDFVGTDPFRLPASFRDDHHVIGNRMRKGGSDEIRLDERWREELGPAQIAEVDRITASTRRRLGFD